MPLPACSCLQYAAPELINDALRPEGGCLHLAPALMACRPNSVPSASFGPPPSVLNPRQVAATAPHPALPALPAACRPTGLGLGTKAGRLVLRCVWRGRVGGRNLGASGDRWDYHASSSGLPCRWLLSVRRPTRTVLCSDPFPPLPWRHCTPRSEARFGNYPSALAGAMPEILLPW